MPDIKVSDIEINVVHKDVKNLHLSILPPDGKVRITAPLNIDEDAVRLFAVSKISWIKKSQIKYLEQARQTEREYVSGESHYFKGQRYLLNVISESNKSKVQVRNKTYIDLYVPHDADLNKRKKVLNNWYRKCLAEELDTLVPKWQEVMNIQNVQYQIKEMKTKWGSCKEDENRIWLNLNLIKKPTHCLEYVIVHEMTHLLERSHNERFVAYMDQFLPNWRQYKQELNEFILDYSQWDQQPV